jgi:hypothetical protein
MNLGHADVVGQSKDSTYVAIGKPPVPHC